MRWIAAIAYSLLLLVGFIAILERRDRQAEEFVAARDIAPGQLVRSGDIAPRTSAGYATREIKSGRPIRPEDLAGLPPITWPDGTALFAFPTERGQVEGGAVKARATVRLCQAKVQVLDAATVQEVVCDSAACLAIVAVPADQLAKVAGAFKSPGAKIRPVTANEC